ncbi:hypothetical protein I7I51_01515 [Histoplasma capsulatum]|uniref:Ankyrin repeat protein n=1 Tax=Ajellomyces capsulatus TaxID=5037 RepID=A0A8A1MCX6_AJECA|nr:hypothetical protein I7I51_01515 [Histoplasma capsulatum]
MTVELLVGSSNSLLRNFRLWFKKEAEINSRDSGGHTAVVKVLLEAGASSDSADEVGGTPLLYALYCM